MNRRTFFKKMLGILFGVVGLGGGTFYYARDIEPKLLNIQHEKLYSNKIPKTLNGFKIIQFSDTHIGYHYSINQFANLVKTINKQEPDLILFTGDLVDRPDTYHWDKDLIILLQELKAKVGKYWIYGNHDHGGYGSDIVKNVMNQGGFTLLQNNWTKIALDKQPFILAGIDDIMLGKPNLKQTLSGADHALFTILMAHEPDYADKVRHFPVDVQLSGHSHGGQVHIPFFGHLYTPLYARQYVEGKHQFKNSALTLFVSRGIGTTRLPYRFLCKPEIQSYTLEHCE